MRRIILPIACSLVLAACQSGSAAITLTPAAVENCDANTKPATVTVHWDASKANPEKGVKVWVSNDPVPTHAGVFEPAFGKVWASSGAVGTETTGLWAHPGMAITVTDSRNDQVLGQIQLGSLPCSK